MYKNTKLASYISNVVNTKCIATIHACTTTAKTLVYVEISCGSSNFPFGNLVKINTKIIISSQIGIPSLQGAHFQIPNFLSVYKYRT